jgi:hypothetical protein
MSWRNMFGSGDAGDAKDNKGKKKRQEADMADAVRDVLGDEAYMEKLRLLAAAGPFTRLKGLVESAELAAIRAERPGDDQMSNASTVQTAQRLVGILNSIANPKPKLQLMASESPNGPFTEFDAPDASGHTIQDYRQMATELAQPLRPLVPNPRLVGGLGE